MRVPSEVPAMSFGRPGFISGAVTASAGRSGSGATPAVSWAMAVDAARSAIEKRIGSGVLTAG